MASVGSGSTVVRGLHRVMDRQMSWSLASEKALRANSLSIGRLLVSHIRTEMHCERKEEERYDRTRTTKFDEDAMRARRGRSLRAVGGKNMLSLGSRALNRRSSAVGQTPQRRR